MVAICAFLIILVILFGVEAVRGFFFGTLGVVGWVLAVVLGLGLIISIGEGWHKIREEEKREAAARKKQKQQNKANLKALKTENPAEYKKLTAGSRLALYMYGGAILIAALALGLLLIFVK